MSSTAPIAIRIVRPYSTVDEFLAHDLRTLSPSGVMLIGAPVRSKGLVLRFEIALESGIVALRGEGRVVGYREKAFDGIPALVLRFTRLDPTSKALIDRVVELLSAPWDAAPISSSQRDTLPERDEHEPPPTLSPLQRLRERAQKMSPEELDSILSSPVPLRSR